MVVRRQGPRRARVRGASPSSGGGEAGVTGAGIAGPGISQSAVDGIAMYRNPEPWRNSPDIWRLARTEFWRSATGITTSA